jgi:oligoribonuclease NrnB/cAMP/cGMP phosphodiesterase (DHH superfamily)
MVKLFTHTDLDGVGCAILAKIAFGSEVDIDYCNYNEINDKVNDFIITELESDDMVHITDISVSDELANDIEANSNQFYLLDHHPTALELNKYKWCKVTIEDIFTGLKTSGTELYYNWLVENGYLDKSGALDKFVEVVRDYDTWRWATLGNSGTICKQVNDLLYLYGREEFITWCMSQIHDATFPALYAADKLVLDLKQKEIDDYVESKDKQLFTSPMCGKICGFVFAEKYFSELGNRLCKLHPEIDFIAMIDMDGTVSYRTVKDDIDLGKDVASLFGGGGHPKAAGSRFPDKVKLKLIENIFS